MQDTKQQTASDKATATPNDRATISHKPGGLVVVTNPSDQDACPSFAFSPNLYHMRLLGMVVSELHNLPIVAVDSGSHRLGVVVGFTVEEVDFELRKINYSGPSTEHPDPAISGPAQAEEAAKKRDRYDMGRDDLGPRIDWYRDGTLAAWIRPSTNFSAAQIARCLQVSRLSEIGPTRAQAQAQEIGTDE